MSNLIHSLGKSTTWIKAKHNTERKCRQAELMQIHLNKIKDISYNNLMPIRGLIYKTNI